MPDSTNVNRDWFRYTGDDGRNWAMKVGRGWGNSADSGFVAYGGGGPAYGADPPFPMKDQRNRPRSILCMDLDTGRTTRVRVGAPTAEAWTNKGYVFASGAKGIAGAVNYTRISGESEHVLDAHAIRALPEHAGA